ncbi:hypothetical protein [Micromonospora sp. WMMD737]|uniref:hypothetical protein n=1 Tax=Micromonospora sp. WMMD737 TaxID=3404113 RepID=UPI003B925B8E
MTAVVCYSRCWSCQFGQHEGGPHTWMDAEDAEFSPTVATVPGNAHAWKALAETHPCNCWCLTTAPCRTCQGSGSHPANDMEPCNRCEGRGHPAEVVVTMRAPDNVTVEHGPDAVRRELAAAGATRLSIRPAIQGCAGCREWTARRARLAALHRSYRQRKAHR